MVAGDNPNRVGGAIGFIGNLIDNEDIAGSAARTSLVFTMLWIPVIIVYAVITAAQDYTTASYDVSKARGVSDSSLVLAQCVSKSMCCSAIFIAFNGVAFIFKLIQYGGALSWESIARFAVPAGLAAIVLVSLFMETFALYQLTRSAAISSVIAIVLSLFVMALFPSSYGEETGSGFVLLYLSPVFYLMNVCALCFGTVGVNTVLLYVAVAIPTTMLIAIGALKAREVL